MTANAKDLQGTAVHSILMLGDIGHGKTTQILTLEGKKYVYIFEPNALRSLQGFDIDYDLYLPTTVSAAASSLKKGASGDKRGTTSSDVYQQFESEFDERIKSGFFDQYNWICLDSTTTLIDLIMDRVLTINGRFGQWPQQDDYGPSMIAFINLCRTLAGMGKQIYMTGHLETKQDQVTQKVTNRPMMTGRLINKIPLLFSDIFYADADVDEKGQRVYRIQTMPSGMNRTIRTSIKGLEVYENITIDWTKDPIGQGIGGILKWEAKNLA